MTSTTATATETVEMVGLPATAEEWAEAWRTQFTWTTVEPVNVGQWAMNNMQVLAGTLPSDGDIIASFIGANPRYRNIDGDNARVLEWIKGIAEQAQTPRPAPTPMTPDLMVEALLPVVDGYDILEAALGITRTERREHIRSTLAYQFSNWMRGKYKVSSVAKGWEQFCRRLEREYNWSPSSAGTERFIRDVIKQAREFIAGDREDFMPPALTHDRIESLIQRQVGDFFPGTSSNGRYYAAAHISSTINSIRDKGETQFPADYETTLVSYLRGCFTWSGHSEEEWLAEVTKAIDVVLPWMRMAMPEVEVDDTINDRDTLLAWQMSLHPKASEFQTKAIENAVDDFVDYARFPGFKEGTNFTTEFRRMVGQYGFMKYTGKERRSVLESVLRQVAESVKDKPITDEEWQKRWVRRDLAVSYVSGRYGEQNSMCPVLERATGELGIAPVRKPKHKVRFEGSGVIAEVPVETWYDDESVLRSSAQDTWNGMTEEQRQAAIIEHVKPFVYWADMKLVR